MDHGSKRIFRWEIPIPTRAEHHLAETTMFETDSYNFAPLCDRKFEPDQKSDHTNQDLQN